MDKQVNILIFEDSPADAELVKRQLRKSGLEFVAEVAPDKDAFFGLLDKFVPDILLADFSVPGFDGLAAMAEARKRFEDIPVIIVSGTIGEEFAIECLKAGATDYVLKDKLARLVSVIHRALNETEQLKKKKQAEQALRKSEREKSLLLESTDEIIAYHDKNHTIQWANNAYLKATGLTLPELKGKRCYHAWGLDELCVSCPVTEAIETGKLASAELTPQNQPHWPPDQGSWMVRAAPIRNDDGNIIGAIEIAYDISEEKQAEQAIKTERDKLFGVLTSMTDPVYIVNQQREIEFANPAFEEDFGKVNGRKCFKCIACCDEKCAWCRVEEVFTGKTIRWEFKSPVNEKEYDVVGSPLVNPDGSVFKVAIMRDVTLDRQAERRIKDLARFPEEDPYPVLRISKDGTVLYSNYSGRRLLKFWNIDINETVPEDWCEIIEGALDTGRIGIKETEAEGRIFSFSIAPVVDSGYANVYGRDITEQRKRQKERDITLELMRLVNGSTGTRDLIAKATAFFAEQSGCEAIGIRLKDGEDYPYYETRGFGKEFVEMENSLCASDLNGQLLRDEIGNPVLECMCGNVICGRFDPSKPFFTKHGSFWSNCTSELLATTTEADRQSRTCNRCNGSGYESVALLPLHVGDERIGLVQLNDKRRGRFTLEAIQLWENLADQLATAIAKFEAEDALRKSNEELGRFNRAAEGRELRMIELKKQVNALREQAGQPPRYKLDFDEKENPKD